MAPRANRRRGVSLEHGTRLRPREPACRVRGDGRLARRGAGSGAGAGARFRRCAARALGSHGRGRRRRVSVVARGAAAHGDRAHGPVRRPRRQRALRRRASTSTRAGSTLRVPVQYEQRSRRRCVSRARCAAIGSKARRSGRGRRERAVHWRRARRRSRGVRRRGVGRARRAIQRPRLDRLDAAQRGARRLLARAGRRARGDVRPASISSRDAAFRDFRLHAELKFPPGSNSGVYLRGRYEVQIQDDAGKALDPLRMGGVYGFIAPSVDCGARGRRVADARRRARRPARHGRVERHDDHRRPRDPRHHGRRARQRRGRAGADHAPGRSRRDRVPQSDDRARALTTTGTRYGSGSSDVR